MLIIRRNVYKRYKEPLGLGCLPVKIVSLWKERYQFLKNPIMKQQSFETSLRDYLYLLIVVSIIAGTLYFLISIGRAAYYDIFLDATVQYLRLLNYAAGAMMAILFFYFFAGTFLLFILSMFLLPIYKKAKYTKLLTVIFLALSPVLLFGWIPILLPGLFVWSIVLFIARTRFLIPENAAKGTLRDRQ